MQAMGEPHFASLRMVRRRLEGFLDQRDRAHAHFFGRFRVGMHPEDPAPSRDVSLRLCYRASPVSFSNERCPPGARTVEPEERLYKEFVLMAIFQRDSDRLISITEVCHLDPFLPVFADRV